MTGVKVEVIFDSRATDSDASLFFYHRQPDVGWVLDGSQGGVAKPDLETDAAGELASHYPENEPPA